MQNTVDFLKYHALEIRGQYFIEKGAYSKAQEILEIALSAAVVTSLTNKKFPKEARITMRMGDAKKKSDELISAVKYYQNALKSLKNGTEIIVKRRIKTFK